MRRTISAPARLHGARAAATARCLWGEQTDQVGSPSSGTVTLYDTTAPTITITPTSVTKAGSKSNQNLTFTVTLSGSSPNATGVTIKTVNGTAVSGTDFQALSSTLAFAAGVTSQTVTVVLLGKKVGSVNKAFTVTLSSPTGGGAIGAASTSTVTITGTSAQVAADTVAGAMPTMLSSGQLDPVVAAAERVWEGAGIAPSVFAGVRFVITSDLPFGEVGYTDGNTIYLDGSAAGLGWSTSIDSGFDVNGTALPGSGAAGHLDLLTVVLHELGHVVGLPDGCVCGAYTELMQATLPAGLRRLPATVPAARLIQSSSATVSPGTVSLASGGRTTMIKAAIALSPLSPLVRMKARIFGGGVRARIRSVTSSPAFAWFVERRVRAENIASIAARWPHATA